MAKRGRKSLKDLRFAKNAYLIIECRCSKTRGARNYQKAREEGWEFKDPPKKSEDMTHTWGICPSPECKSRFKIDRPTFWAGLGNIEEDAEKEIQDAA